MVLWKNYKNWQSLHHPLHLHYITICYTILPLPPPPPPPQQDRTLELSPQTLFTFARSPHFACINIYMEESVISGSKLMASFCAFIHWHRNIYYTPSVTILAIPVTFFSKCLSMYKNFMNISFHAKVVQLYFANRHRHKRIPNVSRFRINEDAA